MEFSEQRKRSVPGVKELVVQIKAISDSIANIDSEIKASQEQISSILATLNANSPRVQLMTQSIVEKYLLFHFCPSPFSKDSFSQKNVLNLCFNADMILSFTYKLIIANKKFNKKSFN